MKPRLLVVGQAYIDFVCRTEAMPQSGHSRTSNLGYAFVAGGDGTYMAVGASRLGADTVLCTSLGNDSYSSQLKKKFENEGVDTRFINVQKGFQTGMCVNLCDDLGQTSQILYPSAMKFLSQSGIEDAFSCYPDGVLASTSIGQENLRLACALAKQSGAKAYVDLSGTPNTFNVSSIQKAEIVFLDDKSIYSLCGMYTNDVNGCLNACISLSAKVNAKYFVIDLFNRGCFVYDGTYSKIITPPDFVTTDKTASHQSFCAALAYKNLIGTDIQSACEYACAALSFTASRKGGIASLPKVKDLPRGETP